MLKGTGIQTKLNILGGGTSGVLKPAMGKVVNG